MKSKAIQRWMARGGRVKGYADGGQIEKNIDIPNFSGESAPGFQDRGRYEFSGSGGSDSMMSRAFGGDKDLGGNISKFAQRWVDKKAGETLGLKGMAQGGQVDFMNFSGPNAPGYAPLTKGIYGGAPPKAMELGRWRGKEKVESDNVTNVGASPLGGTGNAGYRPAMEKYNQGGFVEHLPYDYQDEPDFGASGVDTNYGEWDEEEDEQEQPAGITISFASALQKRKRK